MAREIQRTAWVCACLWLVVAWLAYCSPPAEGDAGPELDSADEALAQQIWRTAVHEAGPSVRDVALIHQVTEAHGDTATERLWWLRAHSARVAGTRAALSPRTKWIRQLRPSLERPSDWPVRLPWARHRPWLERSLWWSRALVSGRVVWRPCPVEVQSWDQPSARRAMRRRGWTPVDCGARNLGAAR